MFRIVPLGVLCALMSGCASKSLYAEGIDARQLMADVDFLLQERGDHELDEVQLSPRDYRNTVKAYIKQRYADIGLIPMGWKYEQCFQQYDHVELRDLTVDVAGSGCNILGYIKGLNSEKAIIVGAHYDRHAYAQWPEYWEFNNPVGHYDDGNATGVATLFSIAAYFSDHKPNYDIIFAAWDYQEYGPNLGSEVFLERNFLNQDQVIAYLNFDRLGCSDENNINLVYDARLENLVGSDYFVGVNTQVFDGSNVWGEESENLAFISQGHSFMHISAKCELEPFAEVVDEAFFVQATRSTLNIVQRLDEMASILSHQLDEDE